MRRTGGQDRLGAPGSPAEQPLTLELLADLHAGVFDAQVAAALRRRVAADPQAGRVLAALDATVTDLAALSRQGAARIPDDVASRLETALAAEVSRTDVVAAAGRAARRRRRAGWAGAAVAAAAATAIILVTLSGVRLPLGDTPASDARSSALGVQPAEAPAHPRHGAPAPPSGVVHEVVYQVTGRGDGAASITYLTDDRFPPARDDAAALPWSRTVRLGHGLGATVTAQAGAGVTAITCRVTKDGRVVAEHTSTGPFAVVRCTAG